MSVVCRQFDIFLSMNMRHIINAAFIYNTLERQMFAVTQVGERIRSRVKTTFSYRSTPALRNKCTCMCGSVNWLGSGTEDVRSMAWSHSHYHLFWVWEKLWNPEEQFPANATDVKHYETSTVLSVECSEDGVFSGDSVTLSVPCMMYTCDNCYNSNPLALDYNISDCSE